MGCFLPQTDATRFFRNRIFFTDAQKDYLENTKKVKWNQSAFCNFCTSQDFPIIAISNAVKCCLFVVENPSPAEPGSSTRSGHRTRCHRWFWAFHKIHKCLHFFKTKELRWNYQFYGLRRMNYPIFSSRDKLSYWVLSEFKLGDPQRSIISWSLQCFSVGLGLVSPSPGFPNLWKPSFHYF